MVKVEQSLSTALTTVETMREEHARDISALEESFKISAGQVKEELSSNLNEVDV